MKSSDKIKDVKKQYTTQRVDVETVTLIKALNLNLVKRGVKMRQSDLINAAFRFIKTREWEFIEFVESRNVVDDESLFQTVSRVVSKPWFPYPYNDMGG